MKHRSVVETPTRQNSETIPAKGTGLAKSAGIEGIGNKFCNVALFGSPVASPSKTFSMISPPLSTNFTFLTLHVSFSLSLLGTSLFNWTNESPLFFRGLSVSRWHTSSRRAIEGRLWRGRCGSALFTNTTWPCEVSQRWEPEVWHPQALPVLPFFIDGCSPPRSARNLAGFQTLDRPHVLQLRVAFW